MLYGHSSPVISLTTLCTRLAIAAAHSSYFVLQKTHMVYGHPPSVCMYVCLQSLIYPKTCALRSSCVPDNLNLAIRPPTIVQWYIQYELGRSPVAKNTSKATP